MAPTTFPTKAVKDALKGQLPADCTVTEEGLVCLTAVLEYAACELLEVAGNMARTRQGKPGKATKVTGQDVDNALNTPALGELFR